MKKILFGLLVTLAFACTIQLSPRPAVGDGVCYTGTPPAGPTPIVGFLTSCTLPTPFVPASPTPAPTQPYSVILTSPLPVPMSLPTSFQTAFPTAIPRPTDTAGNIIAVTPANYSTPMAVSVAATACPGNCLTVTAPYAGSVSFNISGLTGLGATVTFKASNDNVTFTSVNVVRELNNAVSSTTTTDGIYKIDATNGEYISAQVTTAGSGSMNISYVAKNASSVIKVACVVNCATPIPFPTLGVNVINPLPTPTGTPSGASTSVVSSATSVTLLPANAARNGYSICNESTQILYETYGGTATATNYFIAFPAQGTVATCDIQKGVGIYKGIISGIWASANGNARVTEW